MSVAQIPSRGGSLTLPLLSAGTYSLPSPIGPGLYRIRTDTTQSFAPYFPADGGYRYTGTIKGGQGYFSIGQQVSSIYVNGSFPLILDIEQITSYALIAAPTNVSFDYETAIAPYTTSVVFTAPAGATSMGIYWPNGTFLDLATTTSPKTGVSLVSTPVSGEVTNALVVARDANGVWGLPTANATPYPFYVFTTSDTYVRPAWATSSRLIAVGAGGGAGGGGNVSNRLGGSGGGAVATATPITTSSASFSFVIGAGGAGGTGNLAYQGPVVNASPGGTTTVLGVDYAGGLGGGSMSDNYAAGGGASGNGNAGGAGLFNPSGNGDAAGGGGFSGPANPRNVGGPGVTPDFNLTLGAGGKAASIGNYGYGATGTSALNGAQGRSGAVIIKALP